MKQIKTVSAEQTNRVGILLGSILNNGDVICLTGGLGVGKTAFTGGIAAALGIKGYITSPTFTIINEYSGIKPLYHFDVYRIDDPDEMFEIGFDEYIDSDGIVVIEWADRIMNILPDEYIWVKIEKEISESEDTRIINIDFIGNRYIEIKEKIEAHDWSKLSDD